MCVACSDRSAKPSAELLGVLFHMVQPAKQPGRRGLCESSTLGPTCASQPHYLDNLPSLCLRQLGGHFQRTTCFSNHDRTSQGRAITSSTQQSRHGPG